MELSYLFHQCTSSNPVRSLCPQLHQACLCMILRQVISYSGLKLQFWNSRRINSTYHVTHLRTTNKNPQSTNRIESENKGQFSPGWFSVWYSVMINCFCLKQMSQHNFYCENMQTGLMNIWPYRDHDNCHVQTRWSSSAEMGSGHRVPLFTKKLFETVNCWQRENYFSPMVCHCTYQPHSQQAYVPE